MELLDLSKSFGLEVVVEEQKSYGCRGHLYFRTRGRADTHRITNHSITAFELNFTDFRAVNSSRAVNAPTPGFVSSEEQHYNHCLPLQSSFMLCMANNGPTLTSLS